MARSNNGTLFHDLDFLAYHPVDRFETHHLIGESGGEIDFVLPAGVVSRDGARVLTSPVGASIGGPVLLPGAGLSQIIAVVDALQRYASANGFAGIDMTLAPPLYAAAPSDVLGFALFYKGFRLDSRRLSYLIDLAGREERYRELFRQSMASNVRAAKRKGTVVIEGGVELLPLFSRVFNDTYGRHSATPTHSLAEIASLLTRYPNDIRLFLSVLGCEPTAGILLMRLNAHVAYSFYICRSDQHARAHGASVILAALLDTLGRDGIRWLDLGPSARPGDINGGVVFFKEGVGGTGFCRDDWMWRSNETA